MPYQHFALEEGDCLAGFWEKGRGIRVAARMPKRPPSAASRGGGTGGKGAIIPMGHTARRSTGDGCRTGCFKGFGAGKLGYVVTALNAGHWSPGQVAGRWGKGHPGIVLGCPAPCRHIRRGYCPGGSARGHLRRRGKRNVGHRAGYNTPHLGAPSRSGRRGYARGGIGAGKKIRCAAGRGKAARRHWQAGRAAWPVGGQFIQGRRRGQGAGAGLARLRIHDSSFKAGSGDGEDHS